jgi:hypothetical protein
VLDRLADGSAAALVRRAVGKPSSQAGLGEAVA